MTQYNLLRNSLVETLTTSGTGNKEINSTNLICLYDNNTTSSGISLVDTDIVFFEIDLYNRIKLNMLALYVEVPDRATALAKVNFYYKNNLNDPYLLLDKTDDLIKFYADNLPVLFAPRFIRIVINGIIGNLYEIAVINDDYDVAFGVTGETTELSISKLSEYSTLPIFNNADIGTAPVTAYISVDFKHNYMDYYLSLSNNFDSNYKSIMDATGLSDEFMSNYTWSDGTFCNTKIVDNKLTLLPQSDVEVEGSMFSVLQPTIGISRDVAWNVSQACWAYNLDGNIYAINRYNNGVILILYKFDHLNKIWSGICQINTVYSADQLACMTVVANYIYVLLSGSGIFVRYNLNGPIDNLEVLSTCPNNTVVKVAQALCSDKVRYIYSAFITNSTINTKALMRYDTTTNSWTTLNSNYLSNISSSGLTANMSMSYDLVRNSIYMDCGEISTRSIQKYDISIDSWTTNWFPIVEQAANRNFSYCDNYLVYTTTPQTTLITVFNMRNGISYTFNLPYATIHTKAPYMLCFPGLQGEVNLVVARINSMLYADSSYFYTLGRAYNKAMTGYYTTPIMSVSDKYCSTYLYMDYVTYSGTSVSYTEEEPSTVLIKSSDTMPRPFFKLFGGQKTTNSNFVVFETDMSTGALNSEFSSFVVNDPNLTHQPSFRIYHVMFDSFNGALVFLIMDTYNPLSLTGSFTRCNLNNGSLTTTFSAFDYTYAVVSPVKLGLDALGNIWGYGSNKLFKMSTDLGVPSVTVTYDSTDFLYSLAANLQYPSCWYTNKSIKKIVHVNSDGTEICAVSSVNPTIVCASVKDGGCFVVDIGRNEIINFDYYGNTLNTITISKTYNINMMVTDFNTDGEQFLWILDSNKCVLRISMTGEILSDTSIPLATSLSSFNGGCVVHSSVNITYYLNSEGNIVTSYAFNMLTNSALFPCAINLSYKELINKRLTSLYNYYVEDPFWGTNVDTWRELNVHNNILPSKLYHQIKLKLTSEAYNEARPVVKKILIPEPIKINDIQPKSSKPVYLKVDFPANAEYAEYETTLKCWWGNEEV